MTTLAEPPTIIMMKSRRQSAKRLPFYPTIPPPDYPPNGVSDSYGNQNIQNDYGTNYGIPDQPVTPPQLPVYGAPATPAPIIHKHIYVHVRELLKNFRHLNRDDKVKNLF